MSLKFDFRIFGFRECIITLSYFCKEGDKLFVSNLNNFQERHYEIYLCKNYYPYQQIACLSQCAINRSVKWQLSGISELEFDIPMYWNDVNQNINEYFDLVNAGSVIQLDIYIDDELQSQELFSVRQISLITGDRDIKVIQCFSLQDKLNKIKVRNFKGTTKIYDPVNSWNNLDPTQSGICNYLFDILMKGTWSISYISNSLLNTYRTFDISEFSILETINQIQEIWGCIFLYDTFNQTISIKDYNELSGETGIILSNDNYIKEFKQQIVLENIVTRMYVEGKSNDSTGIRSVNITGENYIDNFSFYRSTVFMSGDLLQALNDLDELRTTKQGQFENYLTQLSTKQSEKAVLETQLSDLESQKRVIENHEDICIKYGTSGGQNYSYWHSQLLSKQTEINNKKTAINNKQIEIDTIGINIQTLKNEVSYESNLTTEQLKQLLGFVNEVTQKIDMDDAHELLSFATQLLALKCTSNYDIEVDLIDVFSSQSECFTWDKIKLGYLVDLQIEDFNLNLQPRITMLQHNPDDFKLSAMISNKLYYNDDVNNVSSHWIKSTNTSTTVDNERDTYKDYQNDKYSINDFINNPIDTATNSILTDNDVTIDRRGIILKRLENPNSQLKMMDDKIIATNDGWNTYALAISSEGIMCNSLFVLTNTNGSIEIDESHIKIRNMDLQLTMDNSPNSIIIKNDEFSLKRNGVNIFRITPSGNIEMKDSTILASTFLNTKAGMTDEGSVESSIRFWAGDTYDNRNVAPFRVTQGGAVTMTSANITGSSGIDISSNISIGNNLNMTPTVGGGINWSGIGSIYVDPPGDSINISAPYINLYGSVNQINTLQSDIDVLYSEALDLRNDLNYLYELVTG